MEEEKQNPHQNEHTKHQPPEGSEALTPKISEAGEIKTLLFWEAPARPFRKKDRSFYTTSAIIVILLVLILFLAREFLLIGTILSLAFVAYVLAFVPPGRIKYRISTQGITIGEDFYFWHFLDSFWFKHKEGVKVLHIQTRLRFPAQLMLVLEGVEENEVKKLVARFLPFHEIPYKGWMEKWTEGIQKHFPLENIHR
ncbi:MAG: hypothetical protein Q8Q91_01265 [Candidatus Daviesbacteria bacterium]|nr:hypothetical protein [Candidatus Daviesbacteria bacterium]